jgi:hypothetical protein
LDCGRPSARAIHNDIVATLGPNIMEYSTFARDFREVKSPFPTKEPPMLTIESLATTTMKPSCPFSTKIHVRLFGSYRDTLTSIQ